MTAAVSPPRKPSAPCFDAGSVYCPCDLATLGQCVACSILRGQDTCDCGWSGMCVYQEFLRVRKTASPRRRGASAPVIARRDLECAAGQQAFILDLSVADQVLAWCALPGSFVLLRPKGSPERFNVPLSVMQLRDGTLSVVVEVRGPKTIALERSCVRGQKVTVVAPFWSGLQGAADLRRHGAGKVLGVAKGIGQAPLVHVTHYVLARGGTLKALLGPGVLGTVFADGLLAREGASVEILPRTKDHNIARIYRDLCQGEYDLLVSEGSDQQHGALLDLLSSLDSPPAFAWSSNLSMTCAEGICGSCLVDGFRGCKAHLTSEYAQSP